MSGVHAPGTGLRRFRASLVAARLSMPYTLVMSETLVKVLFRIPEADRRTLKVLAAERDISSTELVRRLIRQHIAENAPRQDA